jgi:hypothetical protein
MPPIVLPRGRVHKKRIIEGEIIWPQSGSPHGELPPHMVLFRIRLKVRGHTPQPNQKDDWRKETVEVG